MPLIAAALLLSTTVAASAEFAQAPPPSGDKFLVYFYRLRADNLILLGAEIMVDGKKLFGLGYGEYCYAYLPAGTHTIRAQQGSLLWDRGGQGTELTITGNAGETRYARVAVGTDFSGYAPVSMFVLTEVKPKLADRQLAIEHLDPDTLNKLAPEFRQ